MTISKLEHQLALAVAANPTATQLTLPVSVARTLIKETKTLQRQCLTCPGAKAARKIAPPAHVPSLRKNKTLLADYKNFDALSVRARRILTEAGIDTVDQFIAMTPAAWARRSGLGQKTMTELLSWAKEVGVLRG